MPVRAATSEDASAIAMIHIESWRAAYQGIMPQAVLDNLQYESRYAHWKLRLEAENAPIWVAERSGSVAGWMACGPDRDWPEEASRREIHAIYIAPRHYRTGLGTALLRHYFSSLELPAVSCVSLWVLQDNLAAMAFYRQHGFDHTEARKTLSRGGVDLTEVKLTKRLI